MRTIKENFLAEWFVIFTLSFSLFLSHGAYRTVWGDSSELTVAAFTLSISHITGYPVFTQLIKLAELLPLADIAFRSVACTGLFTSLALGLMAVLLRPQPSGLYRFFPHGDI